MGLLLKDRKELYDAAYKDGILNNYFCVIQFKHKAAIWSFQLDCPVSQFFDKYRLPPIEIYEANGRLTVWELTSEMNCLILTDNKAGRNGETLTLEEIFELYGGNDENPK